MSSLDTYLVSSTAPTILAAKEAGTTASPGDTVCRSGSLGRDGTSPSTRSPSVDHRTGVSPQSDDTAARSTGHSATAGGSGSHRGGRSHHSHEGLPDPSDRNLSAASESTRRKPSEKAIRSVSLRHGRQAYDRNGSPNHHKRVLAQHLGHNQKKKKGGPPQGHVTGESKATPQNPPTPPFACGSNSIVSSLLGGVWRRGRRALAFIRWRQAGARPQRRREPPKQRRNSGVAPARERRGRR